MAKKRNLEKRADSLEKKAERLRREQYLFLNLNS